ncbi:hypothetical protein B9Z65_5405 [Elsinoe australis]|uniref:Uncharacterized protein n=1 Tax=Elsinoe australis TaxID=40998 RepID=A0A2P7ZDY2_9PEZI|nr:hypothetical protein B9Z65_5405 [Elsinoe australis]
MPAPEITTSAADYARSVAAQARQLVNHAPFQSDIFQILADRLGHELRTTENPELNIDVVVHLLPGRGINKPRRLSSTRELDDLGSIISALLPRCSNPDEIPKIILLRGYQPPECLNRIGARFMVNPQVYLRHLQYLWADRPSRLFSSPSLPSASVDIVSLCVISLGEHLSEQPFETLRMNAKQSMNDYLHEVIVDQHPKPGVSLLRGYWVHDSTYFSIEQEITVSLQRQRGQWSLLIWTDLAGPLSSGPPVPWCTQPIAQSKQAKSPLLPHSRSSSDIPLSTLSPAPFPFSPRKIQSLPHISLRPSSSFGAGLDADLMAADPFYCLSDLFELSAYSIDQILKLIEARISENTSHNPSQSQHSSHADLHYQHVLLSRIRKRVSKSLSDIKQYRVSWPNTTNAQQQIEVAKVTNDLQQDFENLHDRIDYLLTRCSDGMNMCMSLAAINGAEKARLQAEKIGQLTWLAFFYTPLSFTTSFFGMNLADFGEKGGLPTWLWFAVSVPIVTVSY